MPNIIGEQIHDYVAKQINKRQKAHGSGQDGTVRTPEQISYLNSKTAWVKLASGVSLDDARVTEEKLRGGTAQMPGSTLATRYVLFNGTSHIENGYLTQRGTSTDPLQDNVTDYYTGTYNVNALTENSEFGLVPMPGIESAEIKCMNRGSIKRATVKIKCYSPEQFQILDLLYMRIGYTMLLEWGNSLYLSNNNDGTNELQEMGFTLVEDPDGFFSDNVKTYYDMLPRIKEYRASKSGNYDALIARVVNFSWQFAHDGSYDITLELLSMGDVIESLKTNISPNPNILKLVDTAYIPSTSETTNSTPSTITPPTSNTISSYLYYQSLLKLNPNNHSTEKIYIEIQGTPTQMGYFIKPISGDISFSPTEITSPYFTDRNEAVNWVKTSYPAAVEANSSINLQPGEYYIQDIPFLFFYVTFSVPLINSTPFTSANQEIKDVAFIDYQNAISSDYLFGYYMRFGHLLEFLKNYIIPNIHVDNQPVHKIIKIDHETFNNPMYHFPFQVSLDPQVCIVNNIDEPVGSKHYFHQLKRWVNPNKQGEAYTMNIYVHHQTIDKCLKDNLDDKGSLSIFNFLDSICKELNKALGGINNLEPIIDEEDNIIRIIDQSYYDPKPHNYELELYGYNHDFKSSNFVRNFNLKTEITPEFATMAAISSTAGGYVKGVENTMFSKWNKGINDRLQPGISAPLSTGFNYTRDEVKETYLKKFWWGHKSAFGLKDTSIELDPQIIENNVSIVSEFYKSIQSEIQLNVNEKYASSTNGFIPINLGVTMDGISGIKIFNELNVSSRFLPPRYPENLHFIIKGVHHKLSNSDWETSVETISIANSDTGGKFDVPYDVLHDEILKILGETNTQIPGNGKMKKGNPPQHLTQVMNSFGITDNLERAHFLAQTAYESGNYTRTSENLRYTTKSRLQAIFGDRISSNELDSYLNNPEKLGNKVYANINGNGNVASGDGYKYRGRGYIQLTGKNNYIDFNNYLKQKGIKDDVVKNPDLVATKYPTEASVFYWTSPTLGGSKNISKVAKQGSTPQDVLNVTKIVAGYTPDQSNVTGKIEYFNYFYQTNTPNSPDLQSGLTLF